MTSERVCGHPEMEVFMDKMNAVVRNAVGYLKKWSISIVVLLSIIHVGLAYIHVRESGQANQLASRRPTTRFVKLARPGLGPPAAPAAASPA